MQLLNYPGCLGDTNLALVKTLDILKKKQITRLASPFLTDGYFETAFTRNKISVRAFSNSEHITQLWWYAKNDIDSLIEKVISILNKYGGDRIQLAKTVENRYAIADKLEKSALMIVLNRLARNGGSMRPARKNQYFSNYVVSETVLYKKSAQGQLIYDCDFSELKQLDLFHLSLGEDMSEISASKCDYKQSISQHENDYLFIYPPSVMYPRPVQGENSEQMEGFDHEGLHNILLSRKNWTMIAEDDGLITQKFEDKNIEIEQIKSFKVTDTYNLLLMSR